MQLSKNNSFLRRAKSDKRKKARQAARAARKQNRGAYSGQ